MSEIDELIVRLEGALKGSVELNETIHNEVHGDWLRRECVKDTDGWRHPIYGKIADAQGYTTSLDAALTLIPEGWTRGLLTWPGYDNGTLRGNAKAELHSAFSSGGGPREIGYAETLPLAICIAALKARHR